MFWRIKKFLEKGTPASGYPAGMDIWSTFGGSLIEHRNQTI
jgi:hypothetical protein